MGQVINVDFTVRSSKAAHTTAEQPLTSEAPVLPVHDDRADVEDTRGLAEAVSVAIPSSGALAATTVAAATPDTGNSLIDACARMRSDTAALQEAVANLRRASADLHRLPALARELCEAAV